MDKFLLNTDDFLYAIRHFFLETNSKPAFVKKKQKSNISLHVRNENFESHDQEAILLFDQGPSLCSAASIEL